MYLRKDTKLLARDSLALRLAPHLVVAPLHQRLLQPDRVLYELFLLHLLLPAIQLQPLQHRVETRIVALAE
jgi:hypothetical protein